MEKRIIETGEIKEDENLTSGLRPESLAGYIGQEKLKSSLSVYIEAAKKRSSALDHCLFYGPPGLGKTTLAGIISHELHAAMKITSGPAIEKPGDLAAILNGLHENDVLFIDEIHRLNRQVEEVLYPAMEDFKIDILIGKGPAAKSVRLNLPPFTLIGATTRAGLLTAPLRDRFGIIYRMEFYTIPELSEIIRRSAKVLKLKIHEDAVTEIARRSRGTPRLSNRLLKRVGDFAIVSGNGEITKELAARSLDLLEVDREGLDSGDRQILRMIRDRFHGGPVGLDNLAAALSEDSGTLEDVYEPYLIQNGFLMRTPKGRVITEKTYEYLETENEKN